MPWQQTEGKAVFAGGLRHSAHMDPEEQRRERESELDPGPHQAVSQVQAAHREEPGLHAHDVQPMQVCIEMRTFRCLQLDSCIRLPNTASHCPLVTNACWRS